MAEYATAQRAKLLDYFLSHADEVLTVGQVARDLSADGVSVSAVYRNISEMEKKGLLKRLAGEGSHETHYQFTGSDECRSHLHFSCKECGRICHVDDSVTKMLVDSMAANGNFLMDVSKTVLYGVCANCSKTNGREKK